MVCGSWWNGTEASAEEADYRLAQSKQSPPPTIPVRPPSPAFTSTRGFDDGSGIDAAELTTARFLRALTSENIAEGEPGLRWIAIALRGHRFRGFADHYPGSIAERERTSLLALPPEWHAAWLFGFRWTP